MLTLAGPVLPEQIEDVDLTTVIVKMKNKYNIILLHFVKKMDFYNTN
jgi:hypothetical protein